MQSSDNSPQVQLNQLDGGGGSTSGGGGAADLAVSHSAKKRAANNLERHLAPDTKKAGSRADPETSGVTGGSGASAGGEVFSDWALRAGLAKAHTVWERQVKNLVDRLVAERDALRAASSLFQGGDVDTGAQFQSLKPSTFPRSKLDDM